jgi:ankyrin repeat protein
VFSFYVQGSHSGCSLCIQLLLDKGSSVIDVAERQQPLNLTALHCLCTQYHSTRYNGFRALIEVGLDINDSDALGRTPLMRLVESGDEVRM